MKKKKQQETQKFVSTEIKQNKMANEDYQKIKAFFVVLIIVIIGNCISWFIIFV